MSSLLRKPIALYSTVVMLDERPMKYKINSEPKKYK